MNKPLVVTALVFVACVTVAAAAYVTLYLKESNTSLKGVAFIAASPDDWKKQMALAKRSVDIAGGLEYALSKLRRHVRAGWPLPLSKNSVFLTEYGGLICGESWHGKFYGLIHMNGNLSVLNESEVQKAGLSTVCLGIWGIEAENMPSFEQIKKRVLNELADPDNAKFRNLYRANRTSVCGEVNSKNKSGAYIGFRPFYANAYGTFELGGVNPLTCFYLGKK